MTANTDHNPSPGGATVGGSVRAMQEIAALARASSSRVHYFRESLPIIAADLGAFHAGIHLQLATESWEHEWCDGSVPEAFWHPAVDTALTEALSETGAHARLYRTRHSDERVATITTLLRDTNRARFGAIAVIVRAERSDVEQHLKALQSLVDFACECAAFVGEAQRAESASADDDPVARALQRAGSYESSMELAYAITNQLQTKSGADVVALGEVRGRRVVVRVISGQDDVRHNAPGVIRIRQALEECLDRDAPIVQQKGEDWTPDAKQEDHRLHRQWHEASGGDAVLSFPLRSGGEVRYIVGLRRGHAMPFRESEVEKLSDLVTPYAPALDLLRRAHRKLGTHVVDLCREQTDLLLGPGRVGRKVLASVLLLALAWFFFGTTQYEISVPGRVLPAQARMFSAPEDGILSAVHVQPGDVVQPGEILCTFDDRVLRLEEERLRAEHRASSIDLGQALADEDRVAARVARAKLDELDSLIALNETRLALTTIRAPFAGEVTGGDLRERVGDRVVKGEPLFEVSADGGWRLELSVPEERLDGVVRGLEGHFAAFARPEQTHAFALTEISPSTTAERGKNIFQVRAELGERPEWLRAGMEGVAKVEIGDRRVSWVMLHDLFDWLHLKFWF